MTAPPVRLTTLDLIGNTPLALLKGPSEAAGCEIYGKCEFANPGASVKDRAALWIIRDAEQRGDLKPGGTIVEGTAGNTGSGIALVANARGYKSVIVMPETQSREKMDTLRALGAELGLPKEMLGRHPFPGPGLAIRIMGEVNKDDLKLLRVADVIMLEELRATGYYDKTWQAFTVLLNVKSVGVMGDNRTYDNTICVRIVDATDGMTATFAHIPHTILENISRRIINEVSGINRVVYDISSKPPATIEWE